MVRIWCCSIFCFFSVIDISNKYKYYNKYCNEYYNKYNKEIYKSGRAIHIVRINNLRNVLSKYNVHKMNRKRKMKENAYSVKKENVTIDNVTIDNVTIDNVTIDNVTIKNVKKENVTKDNVTIENMKNVFSVKKENLNDSYYSNEVDGLEIFKIIKNYEKKWLNLGVSKNDLQLKYCFLMGQEFCYKEIVYNMYIGLVKNCIFLFKETDVTILYQCLYDNNLKWIEQNNKNSPYIKTENNDSNISEEFYLKELFEFFNLEFPLKEQIEIWKKKDKRIREIADKMKGLRLLKLDPRESFFSFICSSNNNIPRITLMNECLRKRYGKHIATIVFQGDDIIVKTKRVSFSEQKYVPVEVCVKREKEEDTDTERGLEKKKKNDKEKERDKKSFIIESKNNKSVTVQTKKEKQMMTRIKRETSEIHEIKKKVKMEMKREEIKKSPQMKEKTFQKKEVSPQKKEMFNQNTEEQLFYQQIKEERRSEVETKIYSFYEFPTVETLSHLAEKNLRDLGFGYRSTFIINSAKMLYKLGADQWLQELKKESKTINCINKLLEFPGIGLKVANCICLFGLHRYDCIPIDTHIYDIIHTYYKDLINNIEMDTSRRKEKKKNSEGDVKYIKNRKTTMRNRKGGMIYDVTNDVRNGITNGITNSVRNGITNDRIYGTTNKLRTKVEKKISLLDKEKRKGLTRSLYAKLFEGLKNIFGPNCGWAQTMLFTAELKKFSDEFKEI